MDKSRYRKLRIAPIKWKAACNTAHSVRPRAMNFIAGQPNLSTIAMRITQQYNILCIEVVMDITLHELPFCGNKARYFVSRMKQRGLFYVFTTPVIKAASQRKLQVC
jgi:hypothetical protein